MAESGRGPITILKISTRALGQRIFVFKGVEEDERLILHRVPARAIKDEIVIGLYAPPSVKCCRLDPPQMSPMMSPMDTIPRMIQMMAVIGKLGWKEEFFRSLRASGHVQLGGFQS